jgi:SAM-dependent methyltransferase
MKKYITWEEAVLWLREQPDQKELVRACYYDDPLLDAAERYAESEEWQAIELLLPKPGYALDLGAGRGISSYALARAGWKVDALEPDASKIVGRGAIQKLALESNLDIAPMQGYAEQNPCEAAHYDLVYGRQVMHHAKNLLKMCNEVARTLKPGGKFIATREHVISRKEDLSLFLSNHPLHYLYGGENAFLLNEYLEAIKESGLSIERVFGPFDTPINYFPMTTSQWWNHIQGPITRLIGERLTRLLLPEVAAWTNGINRWLAIYASWRDDTPGRLYTFIASKPVG